MQGRGRCAERLPAAAQGASGGEGVRRPVPGSWCIRSSTGRSRSTSRVCRRTSHSPTTSTPPATRAVSASWRTRTSSPQPARDLPPREAVCRQRPHLRPLQRAPHPSTPRLDRSTRPSLRGRPVRSEPKRVVHFSLPDTGAVLGAADQRGRTIPSEPVHVRPWLGRTNSIVTDPFPTTTESRRISPRPARTQITCLAVERVQRAGAERNQCDRKRHGFHLAQTRLGLVFHLDALVDRLCRE